MSDSRTTTRRFVLALVIIPLIMLSFIFSLVLTTAVTQPVCNPSGAAVSVDPSTVPAGPIAGYGRTQLVNAAQVMLAAQRLGLTVRDQTIGVMTAMGESSLTVIDYGDGAGPDSRGLFQQRGNGAWGSYSDRMDPFISATNFFKAEAKVPGREALEPTLVAHAVQGNADPYHYAAFWEPATAVVQALGGIKSAQPTTAPGPGGGAQHPGWATSGMRPQTALVATTIGTQFNLKTIGGYRPISSPYDDPVYGHASGLSIDFMTNDAPGGSSTGTAIAQYLQEHANDLGVQYVIWEQHIWSPSRADEGWRKMRNRGDPTQNHMDHVHLSLNGTGGTSMPAASAAAGCPATPPAGQTGPVAQSGWAAPAAGPMTSPFGMRTNPVTGVYKLHSGIDIGAPCEAPVYAANAGTVTQAGTAAGYGNLITVDHGSGVVTRYGHEFDSGVLVHAGDVVKAGQQIGRVGTYGNSTGCHLHFEVMQNGTFVDPSAFLAQVGVAIK